MKAEIHKKANQLQNAIWQLSGFVRTKVAVPRVMTSTSGDTAIIYNEIAKNINQKVADYQYSLMVDALNELQKQYDEL